MSRLLAAALLAAAAALVLAAAAAEAQMKPPTVYEVNGVATMKVLPNGDIEAREVIKFSTSAYVAFKERFQPLSTFARQLSPRNAPVEIENLHLELDDANNRLTATYRLRGAAVYRGNGLWEIQAAAPGEKLTPAAVEADKVVLVRTLAAGPDFRVTETLTYLLPPGATNPGYDQETGKITYTLQPQAGSTTGPHTVTTYTTKTIVKQETVTLEGKQPIPPGLARQAGLLLAILGAALAAAGAKKH